LFPRPREDFIAAHVNAETIGETGGIFGSRFAVDRRQGTGQLALSESKKTKRGPQGPAGSGADGKAADRDVGHALRSVYAKTVSEDVPDELLDLLGKLS
jgi:hypothetical protein